MLKTETIIFLSTKFLTDKLSGILVYYRVIWVSWALKKGGGGFKRSRGSYLRGHDLLKVCYFLSLHMQTTPNTWRALTWARAWSSYSAMGIVRGVCPVLRTTNPPAPTLGLTSTLLAIIICVLCLVWSLSAREAAPCV